MVTRKRCESLENPSGVGEVYEGEEKIAKVFYSLPTTCWHFFYDCLSSLRLNSTSRG